MDKVYAVYLEELKNRVFKILPLCEEKNNYIDKYLESLIHELKGLPKVYPCVLETETAWYVKVMSSLYTFHEDYSIKELHSNEAVARVRTQVFSMINMIDREKGVVEDGLS